MSVPPRGEDLFAMERQSDEDMLVGTNDEPGTCRMVMNEILELRWRALVAICLLTFGSYYVVDFPGSMGTGSGNTIEQYFRDHNMEYTQEMNQLLYSVYSWPNTVLAFFGGLLIDKYLGIRTAALLFTSLVVCGSLLFWVGLRFTYFPLMVGSRVILGIGSESLGVAQSSYVARWFKNTRGVALAFGVTISFSRVGSSFNFIFTPTIAESLGVEVATLAGVAMCGVSLLACIILVVVDLYAVRTKYIRAEPCDDEESVMKLSDVFRLPFTFWALTFMCTFSYTAIMPFISIARNYFQVKYDIDGTQAALYISAYQLSAAIGSPVIGSIVGALGRNTLWLILSSTFIGVFHLVLLLTNIRGDLLMASLGVVYSFLVSGLWPSIPLAVEENVVGVSYGAMTSLQNIGLAVFPLVVGKILDAYTPDHNSSSIIDLAFDAELLNGNSNASADGPHPTLEGYEVAELVFIGSAGAALLASMAVLIADKCGRGILSASAKKRGQMKDEKRESLLNHLPEEERTLVYLHREP